MRSVFWEYFAVWVVAMTAFYFVIDSAVRRPSAPPLQTEADSDAAPT